MHVTHSLYQGSILFDGVYHNFHRKEETNYKDDKLNGISKSFYENGQLKEESNYKDYKRDGAYKKYNKNGQLKIEEFYKNNTNNIESIFLPFRNRLLNYIWRKIYPKIISDKTRIIVLAHLQCESHIARVLYKLKKR